MWESIRHPERDEVHVRPCADVIMHEWSNCACLPFVEAVPCADGSFGWLITHSAWDGRE